MPFAGLDLHKKTVEAVIVEDDGAVRSRGQVPATRTALEAFARRHLADCTVAVEATFHTWPVVDLLGPLVREVVVSNPQRTRAIAEAKIKTDKVDAQVLAHLLRLDYLPRVWQPDPATQQLRRATTERAALTADRTRVKNRIHALLHHRLIEAPEGGLFTRRRLDWLGSLELDEPGRVALDRQFRLLAQLETELAAIDDSLAAQAYAEESVRLLMTLPGVDFAVAQTLSAALGDVHRFPSADKAAAYLGLVPSTRQSGPHCYHGPITKQGRSHARWMLVQAAQHVAQHPGPLGLFFRRLARRKNRNVAVVAAARKLVTIAWHMLRDGEPYRYAQPATTRAKFARLRIRATGNKRKGGIAKGAPRPAAYGTGQPTRRIASLDETYSDYALPPITEPKPGEAAMLERTGLAKLARAVREPKRVPRIENTGRSKSEEKPAPRK